MFSGIVEEMAVCARLEQSKNVQMWDGSTAEGAELTVSLKEGSEVLSDAYIGCSIAVNGVCLTATSIDSTKREFTVGLAPETLRRSNLAMLRTGSNVNIERALKADGRNSGHFVQGHVDCTGPITEKYFEGDSLWIKVQVPDEFIKFIVTKGFICVDGTSLTICDVDTAKSTFTFMLIAHTQQSVIIPQKEIGDHVNIEVDVLAKMVSQSLGGIFDRLDKIEKMLQDK
jgi:riboflavin synthase